MFALRPFARISSVNSKFLVSKNLPVLCFSTNPEVVEKKPRKPRAKVVRNDEIFSLIISDQMYTLD